MRRGYPPGPVEQARRHAKELRALADKWDAEADRIAAFFEAWNRRFLDHNALMAKTGLEPRRRDDGVMGLRPQPQQARRASA